jgi:MtN3 and saliva related transmembrane protein
MTTVVTWVGYAAGTLTTLAFLPQVRQVWKTKSAENLHIGTLVSFTVGITLWLIYGIAVKQMPVILASTVTQRFPRGRRSLIFDSE